MIPDPDSPAATAAPDAPALDLGEMRTLTRATTPTEGHLLKSCLVAAGIPAMLADAHLAQAHPFLAGAAGGVRVMVPAQLLAPARQVLQEFHSGRFELESDAPAPSLAPATPPPQDIALWNPDAAAFWSLFFTPVFGTLLHLLNRRALGERRVLGAWAWLAASLVLSVAGLLVLIAARGHPSLRMSVGAAMSTFLLVWYFSSGLAHSKAVARLYGSRYRRRPLFKAWLVGGAFLVVRLLLTTPT